MLLLDSIMSYVSVDCHWFKGPTTSYDTANNKGDGKGKGTQRGCDASAALETAGHGEYTHRYSRYNKQFH